VMDGAANKRKSVFLQQHRWKCLRAGGSRRGLRPGVSMEKQTSSMGPLVSEKVVTPAVMA